MITVVKLESLGFTGKVWEKGDLKRFYVTECQQTSIFNTKKCKQSVYVDLSTSEVKCFTTCDSQSFSWIKNENQRVINAISNVLN